MALFGPGGVNTVGGSDQIETYGGQTRMKDLAGQTAFVTGAAWGIGLGIATPLSQGEGDAMRY
jgi:hypothetical protein